MNKLIKSIFKYFIIIISIIILILYIYFDLMNSRFKTKEVYIKSFGNNSIGDYEATYYIDGDYYFKDNDKIYKNDYELVDNKECASKIFYLKKYINCIFELTEHRTKLVASKAEKQQHQFNFQDLTYTVYEEKVKFVDNKGDSFEIFLHTLNNQWKTNLSNEFPNFIQNNKYYYEFDVIEDNGIDSYFLYKIDMENGSFKKMQLNFKGGELRLTIEGDNIIALSNDYTLIKWGKKQILTNLFSSTLYKINTNTFENEILYKANKDSVIIAYYKNYVYVLNNKKIQKINLNNKQIEKQYNINIFTTKLKVVAIKDKLFIYNSDKDSVELIINLDK